jgi:hypothetical protein
MQSAFQRAALSALSSTAGGVPRKQSAKSQAMQMRLCVSMKTMVRAMTEGPALSMIYVAKMLTKKIVDAIWEEAAFAS